VPSGKFSPVMQQEIYDELLQKEKEFAAQLYYQKDQWRDIR